MTMTVGELAAQLASSFQLQKAAGWDPVGLQFGDPGASIVRVAVCHEVTPELVDRLIAEQVDLVVTYHPLLFKATTRLVAGSDPAGRAFRLISNGVALATVHTAFDVIAGGTADSLAASLDLVEVHGFGPAWAHKTSKIVTFAPTASADSIVAAMSDAGAGQIGSYTRCSYRSEGIASFYAGPSTNPTVGSAGVLNREEETRIEMIAPSRRVDAVVSALVASHPYEEPAYDVVETRSNAGFVGRVGRLPGSLTPAQLADLVQERLGGVIRMAPAGPIETVAVIPGSGGSFVDSLQVDAVVTGDVSHHEARAAQARGITVIDPGHAATERPGVKALYAAVAEMIGTTIDMTDVDPDPWKER